jgi:hypothetical protein
MIVAVEAAHERPDAKMMYSQPATANPPAKARSGPFQKTAASVATTRTPTVRVTTARRPRSVGFARAAQPIAAKKTTSSGVARGEAEHGPGSSRGCQRPRLCRRCGVPAWTGNRRKPTSEAAAGAGGLHLTAQNQPRFSVVGRQRSSASGARCQGGQFAAPAARSKMGRNTACPNNFVFDGFPFLFRRLFPASRPGFWVPASG